MSHNGKLTPLCNVKRMRVQLLPTAVALLEQATPGSAGFDLYAAEAARIESGCTKVIPVGIKVEVPEGHAGLVCSRSGLAAKHGVHVLNAPGVIDQDYRGEVKVILHNAGPLGFHVARGDRIAQLLVVPVSMPRVDVVCRLSDTARGEGGLGSTGK